MTESEFAGHTRGSVKQALSVLAIVTVICGCCTYLAWKVVLPDAHNPSYSTMCVSRLKQQAIAFSAYGMDFDDRLPMKGNVWMDAIGEYTGSRPDVESPQDFHFRCPQPGLGMRTNYGYAADIHILGKKIGEVANTETMPLVFDSRILTKSAESGLESLPIPGRHGASRIFDRNNIAYLDSHVKPLKDDAPRPNDDARVKR